ncbi:helix-turn-helix domain-containing protein [Mucilaginibacter sp. HD30]
MKNDNSLRKYRVKRKLTQQEVLDALRHSSPSRLSAWENGQAVPSSKHLLTLSKLYRVPLEKPVNGYRRKPRKQSAPKRDIEAETSEFFRRFGKEQEEMT